MTYSDVIVSGPSAVRGSCGGNGAELVFTYTVPAAGDVVVSTNGSTYDTVLHARTVCAESPRSSPATTTPFTTLDP